MNTPRTEKLYEKAKSSELIWLDEFDAWLEHARQLERELAAEIAARNGWWDNCKKAEADLAALRAELAEAKRDHDEEWHQMTDTIIANNLKINELVARAEKAEAELGSARAELDCAKAFYRLVKSERDQLRAENERLRADGVRLDWLGKPNAWPNYYDGEWFLVSHAESFASLRAAIDAAMSAGFKPSNDGGKQS